MLFIHRSQRAVAAFFLSLLIAVAAGGASVAFDAGVDLLAVPVIAATPAVVSPELPVRQEVHRETGAALDPALPSCAGV